MRVLGTGHGDVADGDAIRDRNGRFAVLYSGERAMRDVLPGADDVEPVGDGDEHGIWKWRRENSLAGVARSQQPRVHVMLRASVSARRRGVCDQGVSRVGEERRARPAVAQSRGQRREQTCGDGEQQAAGGRVRLLHLSPRCGPLRAVSDEFYDASHSKGCRPATAVLRLTDRRVISPSAECREQAPWEQPTG